MNETYVVCEPCVKCKYTDCVEVCPMDAFREDAEMLVIDPEECINCDLCVHTCPVDAIYADYLVPGKWEGFIQLNADKAKELPMINVMKKPLAEEG